MRRSAANAIDHATERASAGITSYTYDGPTAQLTSKTDPSGKVTQYQYDPNGSLTKATYDQAGANQATTYTYDATNRLASVTEPTGSTISFAYDANGQRTSKTVVAGGTTTVVNDVYQLGHLAYETDGSGTILASFSYESSGVPSSVVVGSDPTSSANRYYYVYNGHGDTVALVDANGNTVASYAYDTWGGVTQNTESFSNGWHNPYLYDGKDGVRFDAETSLYWMSVRAYNPALGRFISRDPLGRAPLMGWSDQPYAYAGNNPLVNVDPSGQRFATSNAAEAKVAAAYQKKVATRVQTKRGNTKSAASASKAAKSRNVDWSRVLKDALAAVYGAALIAGGAILLGHFIADQAAFMASVELTMILGANPLTVVLGVLSLIANGLSYFVHGVMDILQQFFDMPDPLKSMILGVEIVLDSIALTLSAVWLITSAAGLFESLGRLAYYMVQVGATAGVMTSIVDDLRSGADLFTVKW